MTHGLMRCACAALLLVPLGGCDRIMPQRADLTLPAIDDVEAIYARHGVTADYELSGNVVELRVTQDAEQLRRGGSLWARVGPYIYVFSPGSRELFDTWAGVSAVRVITRTSAETEIARALLTRDRLNEITWRRALNLLGNALQEGTARPSRIDDLVQFGEEMTEYEYNPDYVPPRNGSRR